MILVPSWLFICKHLLLKDPLASYNPSRRVHQVAKDSSYGVKMPGLSSRLRSGAPSSLKKFFQAQPDKADRLSPRIFARIEEGKQKLLRVLFHKPERLGVFIEKRSFLHAAGWIFGFKIGKAPRKRNGGKPCNWLSP